MDIHLSKKYKSHELKNINFRDFYRRTQGGIYSLFHAEHQMHKLQDRGHISLQHIFQGSLFVSYIMVCMDWIGHLKQ